MPIHSYFVQGLYKKIPVRIMEAFTEPVPPHFIEEKMIQLLFKNEKQKNIHPVERVALFHLKFEGIHPFIAGNGRAGRLFLNLDLMQCGYPSINIKFTDLSVTMIRLARLIPSIKTMMLGQ